MALLACCRSPSLEGRWKGPLPLQGADSCATRLEKGSHFNVVCGRRWVGRGMWGYDEGKLWLAFNELALDGRPVPPGPLEFEVEHHGNTLLLRPPSGRPLQWVRTLSP